MRPQHITAENGRIAGPPPGDRAASMRPQHITAENDHDVAHAGDGAGASMRPQHITAENVYLRATPDRGVWLQ